MKLKWHSALPVILMVVFAATRWPGLMPANFSAAYALTFCAGLYFAGSLGWWLPLGALLASDILINVVCYGVPPLGPYMIGNYLAYGGLIFLGRRFNPRWPWLVLLGGGLMGAVLFYLVTNTAAWLLDPLYPKNFAGWIQALTVGTPNWPHTWEFFRNTIFSSGLFTGLFCGAMKLSEAAETPEDEPEEEEEEPVATPEESKA